MNRILLLFFLIFATVYSQNLHQRFEGIPFNIGGITPVSPFNGGMEVPRFQFADIDNDGDLDLFIFDRDTTLNYYRNNGSASSPVFALVSARYQNLNIKNWFHLLDIDGDNDKDLFCGGDSQRVRYYRNIGTPLNANFSFQSYGIKTNTNQDVMSEAASVPTFADMDGDGDFDFFTGSSSGKVTYYQNIGNANNFQYSFVTDFWEGIEIIGGAMDNERHGASAITFADIDADNDRDLYWGDYFGKSIYFIKNTGTPQDFAFTVVDTNSPEPNPYFSPGFNSPGIYDIDNDSRRDIFIGVLGGFKNTDNFVYYRNNGPVNNPQFTKVTDNFIPCIDGSSYSTPAFTDIDNDGDRDMFIGSENSVSFFRNTGSASSPAYNLENDSLPLNIANFNFAPALGDLDGDGKKDMVLGYWSNAKLRYYKNTGTVSAPVFTYQASQMDTMNLLQASAPCLADLDNDGDLDLLVGSSGGRLRYYVNAGSSSSFNYQIVSTTYQNINVGNDSAPTLGDTDNDGDLDLLVGCRLGTIHQFRNDGTASNPAFTLVTSNFLGINVYENSAPCIVDINNDGDKDMMLGNPKGGLFFYENWDVFGIQQIGSETPSQFSLEQNYPNPFNPVTKIRFSIPVNTQDLTLKVYDALGREITTLFNGSVKPGLYEADWDAGIYPSGVYFYRLAGGNFISTRKMVLVK